MSDDRDGLRRILARVRATPPASHPDMWMRAAAPHATPLQQKRLREALLETPEMTMTRDPGRIARFQTVLRERGLAAFVVPRADAHQGEYIMANTERLAWLTGFTGSAGLAIVTPDHAALFVDGRYTLQAPAETEGTGIDCRHFKQPPPLDWLIGRLKSGDRVGYDPAIHALRDARRWGEAIARTGAEFVPVDANPIDLLWNDRPPDPFAPVMVHPLRFAGETSAAKRGRVSALIKAKGAGAVVLNQLDSIAWLLNVRGGDTPATPLVQSFLILGANGRADWFVDPLKLTSGVDAHLGDEVAVRPLEAFAEALDALKGLTVQIDPETTTAFIATRLTDAGATLVEAPDPTTLPKARKNNAELRGARAAHVRDGAAMVAFLAWFDDHALGLDEVQIMQRLEETRGLHAMHRGPSFTTIAGSGPNGAIVHYRASRETARPVDANTFFLLDSGAQYADGTTDITRTLPVGRVSRVLKTHFTLVLKGHIAVAMARFPKGTGGITLDALARQHLWKAGLDFDHGTGHGVGSYLGVHEGPARLSPLSQVPLEPGMILSNEPGCYVAGSHGIRIENLLVVTEPDTRGFLAFETLTLVPIDRRAIAVSLLTRDERAWLDRYHGRVWAQIGPHVEGRTRAWLKRMTAPL